MAVSDHIRIRETSVEREVERLEVFVSRMERRYECTSAQMARDLAEGRARDTAEVAKWMADFQALDRLRQHQARGRATG